MDRDQIADLIDKAEFEQATMGREHQYLDDNGRLLYGILCATLATAQLLATASPDTELPPAAAARAHRCGS